MFRLPLDPTTKVGRWFRRAAASLILVLGMAFAIREALSPDRDALTIVALLAAVSVGLFALFRRA